MTKSLLTDALKRALPFLIVVAAVGAGATMRVRYLQHEMMTRWRGALTGGALTTQATVDEWFTDRREDAEALAASVAIHAAFPRAGDTSPRFSTVLAPVVRRGKFIQAWVVDASGRPIAQALGDSLGISERLAMRNAIGTGRTQHSSVTILGRHAATLSIVAPVHVDPNTPRDNGFPAAVVVRTDIIKAFGPWATGRPGAAMSGFSTPAPDATILISACPEERLPVCIQEVRTRDRATPAALALAGKDTFGLFTDVDGAKVLATTRFDSLLGWGVIRRVAQADALIPYNQELAIEGGFLLVLSALVSVAAYAANRTVRVRRLSAQREATHRLSTVVNASTDGIISLDDTFGITMVNAAVERMLGYSRAELHGQPVFALFAPEWHEQLRATLRDFAESSVSHAPLDETERCIARCANGRLMPVDARVSRAVVDGGVVYVMGLRDVSERVRTETFLQGQRHVLEMIARGAPIASTCDALLAVVRAEAPDMRTIIYGLDPDRHVARLISAADLPDVVRSTVREFPVRSAGEPVGVAIHDAVTVCTPDIAADARWGEPGRVLVANGICAAMIIPLCATDRTVTGALACYFDSPRQPTAREHELAGATVHLAGIALSHAHDAEQLRLSEASFRSFVENTPAAIFRETRAGELQSTNEAMVTLLGYPDARALVAGAAAGHLYVDGSARTHLLLALESDDVARGVELEWRCADGSRVTVRVSARAYRDEHGQVSLWEGYAENVTSLRLAQEALRRSEKLAAVGQLISGVAHELNNPLSSIMHFTEDLLTDDRTPADAEALSVIRDQARRSRAIVRDLLSFVRQREASAQPTCLTDIVAATVRGMAPSIAESGVRVQTLDDPGRGFVLADRAGLEQIVTNIVGNAVQASGHGGQVSVSTRCGVSECELVVEDDGPGIPADVLPRIFDPFFTTKQTGDGTGLGLSVTLGIVEQLGGTIRAEPRGGGAGTRFVVVLPKIQAHVEGAAEVANADPAAVAHECVPVRTVEAALSAASPMRIALIIDDEPTIRTALRRYFTRRGWAVEEAADGRAGLRQLDVIGERIGVVVSDLRMPGFSGIDLHDRLALERPDLLRRFVFSTGDVASAEAASFVQRTLCPVLQKPFELRMLDEIVARIVHGADAERVIA
ncbi:hypothetical protein BH11GEM2_BH11GEM2_20890 [soil metagenome]